GAPKVARFLLEAGVEPSPKDMVKKTPLHYAASGDCAEVVKVLLEAGASLDEKDSQGITPLVEAAQSGKFRALKEMVDFVLSGGKV
ncbi:ankyrin repeat domain-containing protein, partial [Thermovibrio sp.]